MSREMVLIIDDDNDFVEEVSEMLSNAGYRISSAGNHEEAMVEVRKTRPDIILLDIKFAGNGIRTAEELGADNDISDIPLIVVSGHVDEEVIRKLREKVDVRDVLEKTIIPLEFIASIENNLDGS